MRIALILEGGTERAFLPHLRRHLQKHLAGRMPFLDPIPCDGRIPTGIHLKNMVERLLDGNPPADHVIALTDVYSGTKPPTFQDARDARAKMRQWVGSESRFHPHAAQHDFEAWLLPFWQTIQKLAGHNRSAPPGPPESVDHDKPPARHISEVFRTGKRGRGYLKLRDAGRILRENDLGVSIARCPELKALVDTVLKVCGDDSID